MLAAGTGSAEAADGDPELLALDPELVEKKSELGAPGVQLLLAGTNHKQHSVCSEQRLAVGAHCFRKLCRNGKQGTDVDDDERVDRGSARQGGADRARPRNLVDVQMRIVWCNEDRRPTMVSGSGPARQQVGQCAVSCMAADESEQRTALRVCAEAKRERAVKQVEFKQECGPAQFCERGERGSAVTRARGSARRYDREHASRPLGAFSRLGVCPRWCS